MEKETWNPTSKYLKWQAKEFVPKPAGNESPKVFEYESDTIGTVLGKRRLGEVCMDWRSRGKA